MRRQGTITRWNDERGFGFISASDGSGEVFVHISSMSTWQRRPAIGDVVTFELGTGDGQKPKALSVALAVPERERPRAMPRNRSANGPAGERPTRRSPVMSARPRRRLPWGLLVVGLVVAAVLGRREWISPMLGAEPAAESTFDHPKPLAAASPAFQCQGKTYCSEMSCDEARFYLRNCPGVKIDGDGDGIPCEDQCGH